MTAKILVYDIESTGLVADRGETIVFGYKWLDGKAVKTPSVLDYYKPCSEGKLHFTERELLEEAHKVLNEADIQITFNGKKYDLKFLNTKFMKAKLPPLPPQGHVDLYQVARSNIVLSRKSLANIGEYFQLKNQKYTLPWSVWEKAEKGDSKSLRDIRLHCKYDVLMTEELYLDYLRPYVRQHPRVNGYGPCRKCGAEALQRRGPATTIYVTQQYRFQCMKCLGWETKPLPAGEVA